MRPERRAHLQCGQLSGSRVRQLPSRIRYLQHVYRKPIETLGRLIERLLPQSIHAVTAVGFELKVILFVLAASINYL